MLVVELKSIRREMNPAVRFLRSKLGRSFKVKGSQIMFQNTKASDVKRLLRKFLHERRLKRYRVNVVHPRLVKVLGPKKEKRHVPMEKSIHPEAYKTIPYYWGAAAWGEVPK